MKSANFLCFLFFNVHKDNMFTIQIEDGREAPFKPSLYINLACLTVRFYPINVKTAEPIGPNFFVGHNVTPGKVYK